MTLLLMAVLSSPWPQGWYDSYRVMEQDSALGAVSLLPDSVPGMLQALALSIHFTGGDGALEMITGCLNSDSSDFRSWTVLGALLTEDDPTGSEEAFLKAMDLASEADPVLLESLAYLELLSSRPENALNHALEALNADQGFVPATLTAAWALEDLGRSREAVELLDRGLGHHPRSFALMEEKVEVLQNLGMSDQAQELLEEMVRMDPGRTSARRLLGTHYQETGRHGLAVKTFRDLLERKPDDYWTWGQLGLLLERLGRFEAAEECYWEGIAVNPAYGWAYQRLAALTEDPEDRLSLLENAVAADTSSGQAWMDLGLAYEDIGDLQAAADAFRSSLDLQPSSWTWGELGWTLESLGETQEAALAYESGVGLDSAYTYGWQRRGALLRESGDDQAALEWFARALVHTGEDPWILGEMGNILLKSGDVSGSLALFERAVEANHDYGYGLLNLARLYRITGDFAGSLVSIDGYMRNPAAEQEVGMVERLFILSDQGSRASADSLKNLIPGGWAFTRYGWNALGLGYPLDAARAADSAMSLGSDSPWDWIDLGGLFENLDRERDAEACFLAAAELAGDDVEAHREIAGFFYRSGDYAGAGNRLTEALGFDSTAAVLAELGEARLFEGRLGEAEEALRAAIERDPSSVFAICYLGLLEERKGRPESAAQWYLDALRIAPGYSYAESRILYITGGEYDRLWNQEYYSPFSWSLWGDMSFSRGNQEESTVSCGASLGFNYTRGSSVKLSGSMRMEDENGSRERESAYASLTAEHFFTERVYVGFSSGWDRQPLTVRPWQVSSYLAAGWKSWPADWMWLAPEAGVGLVNTRWSVGEERTDRITSFISMGVWMRRPIHWLPNLWLGGSVYLPPGDAEHTVSYANSELDFDLPGPLSLLLGMNLDYTRTPAVETWEKTDLDYYLRLRLGN